MRYFLAFYESKVLLSKLIKKLYRKYPVLKLYWLSQSFITQPTPGMAFPRPLKIDLLILFLSGQYVKLHLGLGRGT